MLAAANRLKHRRDIDRVYKRGNYGAGEGWLSLKAYKTTQPKSRAVVVVSKKIDKRAVVRNRNRRRLAAALAAQWATVPPGYDIVISVHRDSSTLETAKLSSLIGGALRRARVTSSH